MLYCIVYHHNSDKVLSEKSTSSEAFSHENLFWHCFKLPHIEKWIVLHLIIGLYCTDGEIRIEIRNPLERLWLHCWHNLTDPDPISFQPVQYNFTLSATWMYGCVDVFERTRAQPKIHPYTSGNWVFSGVVQWSTLPGQTEGKNANFSQTPFDHKIEF